MKTAVLLSGCGVFDGTEIHEAVFSLLALAQNNLDCVCIAPDIQHNHVLNHTNGEELNEDVANSRFGFLMVYFIIFLLYKIKISFLDLVKS